MTRGKTGRKKGVRSALTPRESIFVGRYLKTLNASEAYIDAGYRAITAGSVGACASRLLKTARVRAAVEAAQAKLAARYEVTADRVVAELARLGFSDIRSVFTLDGQLKPLHDLTDDEAAAVASVEVVTRATGDKAQPIEYIHKLKVVDKVGALSLLCRHLGLLHDKVEHSGRVGVVDDSESDEALLMRLVVLVAKAGKRGDADAR